MFATQQIKYSREIPTYKRFMLNEIYFSPTNALVIFSRATHTKYVSQHSRLEKVIFNKEKKAIHEKVVTLFRDVLRYSLVVSEVIVFTFILEGHKPKKNG